MMKHVEASFLKTYVMARSNLRRDEGAGFAEYALLLALVALVAIVGLTALGESVQNIFDAIATALANEVPADPAN